MRLIDADSITLKYDELAKISPYAIDDMATIDAAPVVHGEWILSHRGSDCFCRKCMRISFSEYNFCPHCGEVMDGGAR